MLLPNEMKLSSIDGRYEITDLKIPEVIMFIGFHVQDIKEWSYFIGTVFSTE